MIPALLALPDQFDLIGVSSRDSDKGQAFASRFNTRYLGSYADAIQRPEVDAVYIALPNSLHYEWIKRSLERGLHVLVEKPLTCTHEQTIELNRLAASRDRSLVENFQFTKHSQIEEILKIISSGRLGGLRCMRSSFGFPPFKESNDIRYQKALGGGALLDVGVYPIRASQLILGNNLKVMAANLYIDQKKEVDIYGGAFLTQTDGPLFSEIAFGFDHFYQCSIELWGSKGRLTTNRLFTAPPDLSPTLTLETETGLETIQVKARNHFIFMLEHFHRSTQDRTIRETEYIQNRNQSRLVSETQKASTSGHGG